MNGIALSPLTMIRLPFLLGFFLLLTGSAPFADAASSGQEQGDGGVVHIGIQETLDPEFFVDTLGPTMRHLRKRFPHLRFHAETFSIAELSQAIQTKSISFFIADSGLFTFLASTEHADDLATFRRLAICAAAKLPRRIPMTSPLGLPFKANSFERDLILKNFGAQNYSPNMNIPMFSTASRQGKRMQACWQPAPWRNKRRCTAIA